METGGLDSQIKQRMDDYRGNPQQLQKRYGANKELLDLLALQKLTSEKKAAAQDMQMKMQQQPETIAQQREQEALALTKQEMGGTLKDLASRTSSTLNQKQRQQQKNMQRLAKFMPRRPAGIAGLPGLSGMRPQPKRVMSSPQAQGLANARMVQAARQGGPRPMARGGIVSFQSGQDVTSPASRAIDKIKEDAALQRLRTQVQTKYGSFASVVGSLRKQSDEQRQYAKDVVGFINELDEGELRALLNAPFTPGMSQADLDNLPSLPGDVGRPDFVPDDIEPSEIVSSDPTLPSKPVPDVIKPTDTTVDDSTTDITLLPPKPYETELSKLTDEDTTVEKVTPKEADRAAEIAARTALTDAMGEVPDAITVEPFKKVDLEPIDPASYLDPQALEMRRSLIQRAADDFGKDPDAALKDARRDSDVYFNREGIADIYAKQLADERALQAETLNPARLRQLARIETLAGGRKGPGGIGAAYAKVQREQDALRSAGLKTQRGIEDTSITKDYNIALEGAKAGQNAAARAQADKTNAATIIGNEIARQTEVVLDERRARQEIGIANVGANNTAEVERYKAELQAINNQAAARREILRAEALNVQNQTSRYNQAADNEQQTIIQNVKNKIEKAKEQDAFVLETERIRTLSLNAQQKLLIEQEQTLNDQMRSIMFTDQNYIILSNNLAGAETEADIEAAQQKLEAYTKSMGIIMADQFAPAFARLDQLRRDIERLKRGSILSSGIAGQVNPNDSNVNVIPVQ
jgi:hypothetical protein